MKPPVFWQSSGLLSSALLPASWLYRAASLCRSIFTGTYHASLPVICVGNITSGGTGKTPITAYLAELAKAQGLRPVILSRGYGGSIKAPTLIDPAIHNASDCGDEPLLLAQHAPVIVSPHRGKGARLIESLRQFDLIIMDDGMQNPQLHKDHIICVFDGKIGVQNGRILPAGPLRAPVSEAIASADIFMINGTDKTGLTKQLGSGKIIFCDLKAETAVPPQSSTKPLFAFAGIGRPERFFETLGEQGYYLAQTKAFGDHHVYRQTEITDMVEAARALSAMLITTQKDWVRLPKKCQEHIAYLPVSLHVSPQDKTSLLSLLPQRGS